MTILLRSEAKHRGLNRYYTGLPCKLGHIKERYTLDGNCVECVSIKSKQWSEQNPERARKRSADWKTRNADEISAKSAQAYAENPEKHRSMALASYYKHRESRQNSARAWKEENHSRVLQYAREWAQKNRERRAAAERNRNARKRSIGGVHTARDVETIVRLQRAKCAACGVSIAKVRYHVDHIVPLKLGGRNSADNLQVLCPPCNLKKRARDPIEWAQSMGRLL